MNVLCTGSGGFVGHHLANHLVNLGHYVRGVDVRKSVYGPCYAQEFSILDLRSEANAVSAVEGMEYVYHLAADMGGIGYITSHRAEILRNNLLIDLSVLEAARLGRVKRLLFSSSACVYPQYRQAEADAAPLKESEVWPADPEESYGWEKLTTEKLCVSYREDWGLDTRIVRFHNVYGPEEAWCGGREKAPAALARKIAIAKLKGEASIEMWGDGEQRRSFIYISDITEGLVRLMNSDYPGPLNLGSDHTVSINELAEVLMEIAGVRLKVKHIEGPQGVRGRNSDNTLCREKLNWEPKVRLEDGLRIMYEWVESQVKEMACESPSAG